MFARGRAAEARPSTRSRGCSGFGLAGVVSFSRFPLRAAGAFGIAALALGLAALALALFRASVSEPLGRDTLLFAAIAVIGGAQLLFTGVLGEYLGAVLDEVRARPHYIVEERINLAATGRRIAKAPVQTDPVQDASA